MWTQESEKKVVRTRISNEPADNSPLSQSLSLSEHVTQTSRSPCSRNFAPLPSAGQESQKTGHGTDGIRDQGLNNEHRQRGRKMQENELISLLVPLVVLWSRRSALPLVSSLLETTTMAAATSSPAAADAAEPAKNERRRHTNKREQNQMTLKLTSESFSLETYYYIEFIMSRVMDQ